MVAPVPPGFVLDEPTGAAGAPQTPPPPPGFVPDASAPAASQDTPGPTVGERRQSGIFPIATVVQPDGSLDVEWDPSAGILGSVIDAVTLPADVMAGRVDPMSQEGIERVTELAFTAAPAARMGARIAAAPARQPLRTADELETLARQTYQRGEDAGLTLSPGGFARVSERMIKRLGRGEFDPQLHPRTNRVMQIIGERQGNTPTMREMDNLRRLINRTARSTQDASDARLLFRMSDDMDQAMRGLKERDVLAGDPRAAVSAFDDARQIWSTRAKTQTIDDMVERAGNNAGQFTGSGFENALRQQFKALANNQRRMRGFTRQEQNLIKRVARSGRIARNIGRVAPTGGMSIILNAMAAGMNPWFALLTAAGIGGRIAATRGTRRRIERVRRAIQQPEPESVTKRAIQRAERATLAASRRPAALAEPIDAQRPAAEVLGP